METRVLLVRHGITEWHDQSRVLGQNDIPLNARGLAQARGVAEALINASVSKILTSPLARASQTAAAIGDLTQARIATDSRLTDLRVGDWEGMTYSDLSKRDDYRRFLADPAGFKIPGGETLDAGRDRAASAIADAIDDLPVGAGTPQIIAVITHSDIVRLLLCHYLGISVSLYAKFRVAVGSVSTVTITNGAAKVLGTNWQPSLREVLFPSAL